MVRRKISTAARWFGWLVLAAYYTTMSVIVVVAYVAPNQSLLLSINQFGEAGIELMITMLSIPCVLYLYLTRNSNDREADGLTGMFTVVPTLRGIPLIYIVDLVLLFTVIIQSLNLRKLVRERKPIIKNFSPFTILG